MSWFKFFQSDYDDDDKKQRELFERLMFNVWEQYKRDEELEGDSGWQPPPPPQPPTNQSFYSDEEKKYVYYMQLLVLSLREIYNGFSSNITRIEDLIRENPKLIIESCDIIKDGCTRLLRVLQNPQHPGHPAFVKELKLDENSINNVINSSIFVIEASTKIATMLEQNPYNITEYLMQEIVYYVVVLVNAMKQLGKAIKWNDISI